MSAVEAMLEDPSFDEFEAWKARKAKHAELEFVRPTIIEASVEIAPDMKLKATTWTLDDASAAAFAPGKCFAVRVILRADNLWQFREGKAWKVSLLEIQGIEI